MKHTTRPRTSLWRALGIALSTVSLWAAPAFAQQGAVASKPAAPLTNAEREAAARLKVETIRAVTSTLAAPDMQGRGTATPGGDKAAKYLADQFARLSLKPLGDAGTYLQAIKFKTTQVLPDSAVKVGDAALKFKDEFIPAPPYTSEQADASGALVLTGYGVSSPELKRDDFAGLDLKGKIILLFGGRPKNVDAATWAKASNPQARIGGLLQRGAAGVLLINFGSKDQPYALIADYLSRRSAALADSPEIPFKLPPIMLISNEAGDKILAGTGTTFAQTLAKLESGETVSRDLNKTAALSVRVKREQGTGSNVVGMLEGFDPKLKEQAIVYTAHYDAWGTGTDGRIYPGAADNALGVGELVSIAEDFSQSKARPRRSLIFLAVTGEEHGLLGSEYWVHHPTWPVERVAADLNFDGIGTEVYAPVKRVVGFGMEYSDLGATLAGAVAANGDTIAPDPLPEEKAFYRSDHYAFVKEGVPALMLLGGPDGEQSVWIARAKKWLVTDYHQPTDIVRPDWNWDGARAIAVIGLIVGMRVDAADAMPAWLPNAPFNHTRGTEQVNAPMP